MRRWAKAAVATGLHAPGDARDDAIDVTTGVTSEGLRSRVDRYAGAIPRQPW